MDTHIYNVSGHGEEAGCEMMNPQDQIENKFLVALSEIIADALNITWRERRIFKALLENNIKDKLFNRFERYGLIDQLVAHEFDVAVKRLIEEFELEAKVDHSHCTHAKLVTIIDELKDKLTKQ